MAERERWLGGPLEILGLKTFLQLHFISGSQARWPLSPGPEQWVTAAGRLTRNQAQEGGASRRKLPPRRHNCAARAPRRCGPGALAGPRRARAGRAAGPGGSRRRGRKPPQHRHRHRPGHCDRWRLPPDIGKKNLAAAPRQRDRAVVRARQCVSGGTRAGRDHGRICVGCNAPGWGGVGVEEMSTWGNFGGRK